MRHKERIIALIAFLLLLPHSSIWATVVVMSCSYEHRKMRCSMENLLSFFSSLRTFLFKSVFKSLMIYGTLWSREYFVDQRCSKAKFQSNFSIAGLISCDSRSPYVPVLKGSPSALIISFHSLIHETNHIFFRYILVESKWVKGLDEPVTISSVFFIRDLMAGAVSFPPPPEMVRSVHFGMAVPLDQMTKMTIIA